ncbi:uncharacterized protein BO87DRAFT_346912, partial [Aspergillus neoniger CBS 115656]
MQSQEASAVRGGILAHAPGLGKTVTALTHIYLAPNLLPPGKKSYRPILICCPASVVGQWADEVWNRFGGVFNVIIFHGFKTMKRGPMRKAHIVETISDLRKKLEGL